MKNTFICLNLLVFSSLLSACNDVNPLTASDSGNIHVPSASEIRRANGGDERFATLLQQLQQRDPVQEAQAARQQGQTYFLCNAGRSNTVPGLSAALYASARHHCPTRCLDGVTDALEGPQHSRYLSAALDYSARWNQTMLAACR